MRVFVVTTGEYSDYNIAAVLVGPDDANLDDLYIKFRVETYYPMGTSRKAMRDWVARMKETYSLPDRYSVNASDVFVGWLLEQGFTHATHTVFDMGYVD